MCSWGSLWKNIVREPLLCSRQNAQPLASSHEASRQSCKSVRTIQLIRHTGIQVCYSYKHSSQWPASTLVAASIACTAGSCKLFRSSLASDAFDIRISNAQRCSLGGRRWTPARFKPCDHTRLKAVRCTLAHDGRFMRTAGLLAIKSLTFLASSLRLASRGSLGLALTSRPTHEFHASEFHNPPTSLGANTWPETICLAVGEYKDELWDKSLARVKMCNLMSKVLLCSKLCVWRFPVIHVQRQPKKCWIQNGIPKLPPYTNIPRFGVTASGRIRQEQAVKLSSVDRICSETEMVLLFYWTILMIHPLIETMTWKQQ